MKERDDEEYKRRENNNGRAKADSVIPEFKVIQEQQHLLSGESEEYAALKASGAVVSTDSESESEFIQRHKGNREVVSFKWTPEYEDKLEEILMKHYFDFHAAAKEFSRLVNKDAL
jgi:hypothetical protein